MMPNDMIVATVPTVDNGAKYFKFRIWSLTTKTKHKLKNMRNKNRVGFKQKICEFVKRPYPVDHNQGQ